MRGTFKLGNDVGNIGSVVKRIEQHRETEERITLKIK